MPRAPPCSQQLARIVNAKIEAVLRRRNARTAELAAEIQRLDDQASYLVRLLAAGGRLAETTLDGCRRSNSLGEVWVNERG
jgi:hypothetical protein